MPAALALLKSLLHLVTCRVTGKFDLPMPTKKSAVEVSVSVPAGDHADGIDDPARYRLRVREFMPKWADCVEVAITPKRGGGFAVSFRATKRVADQLVSTEVPSAPGGPAPVAEKKKAPAKKKPAVAAKKKVPAKKKAPAKKKRAAPKGRVVDPVMLDAVTRHAAALARSDYA